MRRLFGTDGIRGIANKDLTASMALKLGYSVAKTLSQTEKPILIARDTRNSGEMLEHAIAAGISSAGKDVVLCGIIPTPALAILSKLKGEIGVMISASHNPPEYNGIKIIYNGQKLPDEIEEKIEEVYFNEDFKLDPYIIGRIKVDEMLKEEYIDYIVKNVANDLNLNGLNILVDLANGAAVSTVTEVLKRLGANVYELSAELNGDKINVGCGATNPEYVKSEIGPLHDIAASFDGDADRCVMANSELVIDGDYIMTINALYMKEKGTLNKNTLVTTVMSNFGMEKFLNEKGVKVVRTKVGDRYVFEKMVKNGYNLGGEQSGHVIFMDHSPTGDGLITLLRTLKVFTEKPELFNSVLKNMERLPQFLENVKVDDKQKAMESHELAKRMEKAKKVLAGNGRILVRPSGTEKLIRIMVECEDENRAKEIIDYIKEAIKDF
ncbi:MAG: phosphoglucosamine mutase [Thermotogaceae bacterium]|nr:phosphoglucosamine mutase [Thermotogaceae bacterium]MDN5337167.1 phosphoglucosamine mutase [Thermotogaceae bacterium]